MEFILEIVFILAGLCSSGIEAIGLFMVAGIFGIADAIRNHK